MEMFLGSRYRDSQSTSAVAVSDKHSFLLYLALCKTVQEDAAEGEGEGNSVPRGFSSGSPVAPQTASAFRPPVSWNNR